jgi:hypothetical protein
MSGETLHLDYDLSLQDYRRYWRDSFKKTLPNIASLWGFGTLFCLVMAFFFGDSARDFVIFTGIAALLFLLPILSTIFNYHHYMTYCKKILAGLSATDKNVHFTFKTGGDGFECMNGKDFSFTSWSSISTVSEEKDYFILLRRGQPILIPKSAFRGEEQLIFFRALIVENLAGEAKLLN